MDNTNLLLMNLLTPVMSLAEYVRVWLPFFPCTLIPLVSLLYLWEWPLTFSIAVLKKPASVIFRCLKVYQVWSLQVWIIFQAITVNVTNWSLSAEYYVLSFGVLINLLVASGFMKTSYRIRSLGYPMPPPLVLECKFLVFIFLMSLVLFFIINFWSWFLTSQWSVA